MRKSLIFSSFVLKIIAIVLITLDHIGLFLTAIPNISYNVVVLSNVFRSIGRLAMPLFIFMIVEGVLHTKSFKKYILRLLAIAIPISIVIACLTYIKIPGVESFSQITGSGNIFLDLIFAAIAVYILDKQKGPKKLFILLPIAISCLSFGVKCYEKATTNAVLWYPTFLYLQYDWVSVLLGIGFYYAKIVGNYYIDQISKTNGVDRFIFDENGTTQLAKNLFAIIALIVVSIIHFVTGYLINQPFWNYQTQTFAVCAALLILFYNGKRGYDSKWFRVGTYLYYPIHVVILYIILLFI